MVKAYKPIYKVKEVAEILMTNENYVYSKENCKNQSANTYDKEMMNYKEKIIEMVNKINKLNILEYIYSFLKLFLEKWG